MIREFGKYDLTVKYAYKSFSQCFLNLKIRYLGEKNTKINCLVYKYLFLKLKKLVGEDYVYFVLFQICLLFVVHYMLLVFI